MAENKLLRVLGLKESISMTIGTVVGVGLFTCGSSQIGLVGSWIIGLTFVSLLISIWPCLIYGEMSAALPEAGGTYPKFNIAKPFLLQYQPVSNFNLRYCVLQSRIFLKGIFL